MAGWIAVNPTFRELFHSEDAGWGGSRAPRPVVHRIPSVQFHPYCFPAAAYFRGTTVKCSVFRVSYSGDVINNT